MPPWPVGPVAGPRFGNRRDIRQVLEEPHRRRELRGRATAGTHPREDAPASVREPRGPPSRAGRGRAEAVASPHSGGRQLGHRGIHPVTVRRRHAAGQPLLRLLHHPGVGEDRLRYGTRAARQEGRPRGQDGAGGVPPHAARPRPRAGRQLNSRNAVSPYLARWNRNRATSPGALSASVIDAS